MLHHQLDSIRRTDIYLIDQILKGRYDDGGNILDAGSGDGRNISWFVSQHRFEVFALDQQAEALQHLQQHYPQLGADHTVCASLQAMPFPDAHFDHIICQAVLHFAQSKEDFFAMLAELHRVLRQGGSLFIRMASDIGIVDKLLPLGNGRYHLPDGTDRFLLTRALVQEMTEGFGLTLAEPVKTTNVEDIRCMTTLMLLKS